MKRPDIEWLKRLCEDATGGKWIVKSGEIFSDEIIQPIADLSYRKNLNSLITDADFIAESRQAVPELIEYIEKLEKQLGDTIIINNPKEELKLIKEKCPNMWNEHFACECPNNIDDSLVNSFEINDYDDTNCEVGSEDGYCEECWSKALGDYAK